MNDRNSENVTFSPSRTSTSIFSHQHPSAPASSSTDSSGAARSKPNTTKPNLPKGVVLDKDGKPCRLCTDAASWRTLTQQAKKKPSTAPPSSSSSGQTPLSATALGSAVAAGGTAAATTTPPSGPPLPTNDCPPDVEALGRSTWTLLHSLTATYPEKANVQQQTEMRSFIKLFSRLYPCWVCADDFRTWMAEPSGKNEPRLNGRSDFGTWMCEAHNEVNRKLGKKEFDCRFWEERWRTGWKDGRCD